MTDNQCKTVLPNSNTSILRGICTLLILTGHIGGKLIDINVFGLLGSLPVGFFLFVSGYGMMSRMDEDAEYFRQIFARRIVPVLIPFLLANAVYFPIKRSLGLFAGASVTDVFFGGGGVVTYSWFIIAILYFYVSFYLSFRLVRKNALIVLFAFTAVWIGAMLVSGGAAHRYVSVCCFPIGVAAYRYRGSIFPRLVKPLAMAALLFSAIISFSLCVYVWDSRIAYPVIKLLLACSIVLFVLLLTSLALRYDMKSRALSTLNDINLELYLIHGLFMLLYRCQWCYINSDVIYVAAVLVSSIFTAVLFKKLNSIITPWTLRVYHKLTSENRK